MAEVGVSHRPSHLGRGSCLAGRVLVALVMLAALMGVSSAASAQTNGPNNTSSSETYPGLGANGTAGLGGDGAIQPEYLGSSLFAPDIVWTQDFPDPSIVYDSASGRYWAFSTESGGVNVQAMWSTDLVTWTTRSNHSIPNEWWHYNDALPAALPGGIGSPIWAPSVTHIGNRWLMTYAAPLTATKKCVYYATSAIPEGPYTDPKFLQCSDDPGGSIDPSVFTGTDGTTYLVWKDEGLPGSHPPRIWISPFYMPDPTTIQMVPVVSLLLQASNNWEQSTAENPSLIMDDTGHLVLFYSGNDWGTDNYATGVATCRGVIGPGPLCDRMDSVRPQLQRRNGRSGIGGASAFRDASGNLRLAYHYWDDRLPAGYPRWPDCIAPGTCTSQQRYLAVDRIEPVLGGFAFDAEPGPIGPAPPSGLEIVSPRRVLDTRYGPGVSKIRRLDHGEIHVLDMAPYTPPDATAVTLNITAVSGPNPGYVTSFPCGDVPVVSNLNFASAAIVPNLATVQLNASREVCIYTQEDTDLIVDHEGTWRTGASIGLTPLSPTRIVDTRETVNVPAGQELAVQITGTAGAAPGASAVVLNVTTDRSVGTGYLTVFPCGDPMPLASSVNFTALGPSSNAALVGIGAGGRVCVFASQSTDVIVDAFGSLGAGGLRQVPQEPQRIVDTRVGWGAPLGQVSPSIPLVLTFAPGTSAVTFNLTALGSSFTGHVTIYPCASPPSGPGTSNLNVLAGQTRAAWVTTAVDPTGAVCVSPSTPMQLIVDLAATWN
jgi:hypothetical protein